MSYWTSPENISRAKNCNERLHETNSRAENRNYARSHGLPLQKCAPTLVQAPMHVQKLWASVVETFRHTNVYRTNVATIWCRCRNLWQVLLKLLAMPSLYVQPSPTSFVCAHTSGKRRHTCLHANFSLESVTQHGMYKILHHETVARVLYAKLGSLKHVSPRIRTNFRFDITTGNKNFCERAWHNFVFLNSSMGNFLCARFATRKIKLRA